MDSISDRYDYEIELADGSILTRTNNFNPESVVRLSYIPNSILLPRHDINFSGFTLIKRFSRTMLKQSVGVKERLHICVTDKFRFYLFSSTGQTLITNRDYELYL